MISLTWWFQMTSLTHLTLRVSLFPFHLFCSAFCCFFLFFLPFHSLYSLAAEFLFGSFQRFLPFSLCIMFMYYIFQFKQLLWILCQAVCSFSSLWTQLLKDYIINWWCHASLFFHVLITLCFVCIWGSSHLFQTLQAGKTLKFFNYFLNVVALESARTPYKFKSVANSFKHRISKFSSFSL